MKVYAVVTGDIQNFTKLGDEKRAEIVKATEHLLKKMVNKPQDAQVFRGDSYQFITDDIGQIVKKCIQLICWFKTNSIKEQKIAIGTRLSIGIGERAYEGKSVLDSDGEAFHISGRNFDDLAKDEIMRLSTGDAEKTHTYQIVLMFINMIIRDWTIGQAETIYHLLDKEGSTQDSIAKQLKMSQPAINKSLRAARWKEVEKGIEYINNELKKQYPQ